MQYVTIYPDIYECVSDYMKIYHDRFWTFYGQFAKKARQSGINETKWEQFPRNTQVVDNITETIAVSIGFTLFVIARLSLSKTIGKI